MDDEPDTLEVMAELLSMRGAEVATASSAAQALEMLGQFEPDVLVSDISMPGRDGYDLIREIRTGRGPEDLPAVAVTAFAGPEDRKRALSAGFQVHMAKPVDPGELVSVIARLASFLYPLQEDFSGARLKAEERFFDLLVAADQDQVVAGFQAQLGAGVGAATRRAHHGDDGGPGAVAQIELAERAADGRASGLEAEDVGGAGGERLEQGLARASARSPGARSIW